MSIIFILAALGISFGYTKPTYNSMTNSSDLTGKSVAELKVLQSEYQAALQKVAEIEEVRNGLLTKYNAISEEDRTKIGKLMPDNIDSVRLVININNIASSYGMSLRDISFNDSSNSSQNTDGDTQAIIARSKLYSYITFNFAVSGTYDNLMSFLGSLEKSLEITDVVNLSIVAVSATGGSSGVKPNEVANQLYKMNLSTRVYYLNQN